MGGGGGSPWVQARNAVTAGTVGAVMPGGSFGSLALTGLELSSPGSVSSKIGSAISGPSMPDQSAPPTDAEIAAQEPDMERLRRQRLAQLLAARNSGLGAGGTASGGQTIGGGTGKAFVGA